MQADSDGQIVLSMPVAEPFVVAETRAVQTLTDLTGFVYRLSGTDSQGGAVNSNILFHKEGDAYTAIVPAGEYTLTADNAQDATAGTGKPFYRGTSSAFTFSPGGTVHVSIDLGTPQNAEIILVQDATFSSLYDLKEVSFADGTERNNALTADGKSYVTVPADGTVTYIVKATAKEGSHVSDLPAGGVRGTLSVAKGQSNTLNLTAKTISDLMIEMGEGEYDGEFE